ncbi:coiled-coil domain-containing protein 82 [Pelodytes ibericus]
MANTSKSYQTRRTTLREKPERKSKVDWNRTKISSIDQLVDSDESSTETEEETEESEDGDESSNSSPSQESEVKEQPKETVLEEEPEDEAIVPPKKKKKKTSVMNSSDSSSDTDVPIGKVAAKRRCRVDDESDGEGQPQKTAEDETAKRNIRKRRNLEVLQQLSEKRRSRSQSHNHEDVKDTGNDPSSPLSQEETGESENSDSMDGFIENDEDDDKTNGGDVAERNPLSRHEELFLRHHIPLLSSSDLYSHLQRIIKAFLIKAIDTEFLSTLYKGERTKRYAKEMLDSLDYVDKRLIASRLVNLSTRSRWSKRYKERVESYPELKICRGDAHDQSCQACELHRYCKFKVFLSGHAYDNETLDTDDFMANDKQVMKVGSVCAHRTEVYHQLKHFKYHLYQRCLHAMEEFRSQDKPGKDKVEMCLSKMEEESFIKKNVDLLQNYVDTADFFKEENLN